MRHAKQGGLVHAREVVKSFAAYDTDPEILLACMIESGTTDTVQLRTRGNR